jgi:hypothetical protein
MNLLIAGLASEPDHVPYDKLIHINAIMTCMLMRDYLNPSL